MRMAVTIPTREDVLKIFGNIGSARAMAKCACVACNSCTCACSCKRPNTEENLDIWA